MSCCCTSADWKREEIPDHKFDHIDVDEFYDPSIGRRIAYSSVFLLSLKSILVYFADIGAVALLIYNQGFDNIINGKDSSNSTTGFGKINSIINLSSPVKIGLVFVSVLISFILLAFEWRKASRIIKSRDISYAFTSTIAYRWYAIRSYPHYCLFSQIQNSRKTVDLIAFFVYFRFRGWKRLLFAEAPRQFINFVFLFDVSNAVLSYDQSKVNNPVDKWDTGSIPGFFKGLQYLATVNSGGNASTALVNYVVLMITFSIWAISFLTILVAFFVYVPLLCVIRGNLKEYCVHKIDKRIGEMLKRKSRKKLQEARRAERDEVQGGIRPTLPSVDVNLQETSDYGGSGYSNNTFAYGGYAPKYSQNGGSNYGYANSKPAYPPQNLYSNVGGSHYGSESDYGENRSEYSYNQGPYAYQYAPTSDPRGYPPQQHYDYSRYRK